MFLVDTALRVLTTTWSGIHPSLGLIYFTLAPKHMNCTRLTLEKDTSTYDPWERI